MPKIKSLDELNRLKEELSAKRVQDAGRGFGRVTIGMGSCGIAAGAREVLEALVEQIKASQAKDIEISQTGCIGLCAREPIVEVVLGGGPMVAYGNVDQEMARRLVREHVLAGKVVQEFVIEEASFPAA